MVEEKSTAKGYIYVLSNVSYPNLYKIGLTTRDVNKRVEELSSATGVPTPFVIEYTETFNDCIVAEQYIHRILEIPGGRVSSRREFFNVSLSKIIETIDYVKKVLDDDEEVELKNNIIYSEADIYIQEAKELFERVHVLGGEKKIENKLIKAARLNSKKAYFLLAELYSNKSIPKLYDKVKAETMFEESLKLDKAENLDGYTELNSEFYLRVFERAIKEYEHNGSSGLINSLILSFKHNDALEYWRFLEKIENVEDRKDKLLPYKYFLYRNVIEKATEEQKEISLKASEKLIEITAYSYESFYEGDEWDIYIEQKGLENMTDDDFERFKLHGNPSNIVNYYLKYSDYGFEYALELFEIFLSKQLNPDGPWALEEEQVFIMKPFIDRVVYLLRDTALENTELPEEQRKKLYGMITGITPGSKIWSVKKKVWIDYDLYTPLEFLREVSIECLKVEKKGGNTELTVKVVHNQLNIHDNILITKEEKPHYKNNLKRVYTIDRLLFQDKEVTNIDEGDKGKIIINQKLTDRELSVLERDKMSVKIIGNSSTTLPKTIDARYSVLEDREIEKEYLHDLFLDYENYQDINKWYTENYSEATSEINEKFIEDNSKYTESENVLTEGDSKYSKNEANLIQQEFKFIPDDEDLNIKVDSYDDLTSKEKWYLSPYSNYPYLPDNWFMGLVPVITIIFSFNDLMGIINYLSYIPGLIFVMILLVLIAEGLGQIFNFLFHLNGIETSRGKKYQKIYRTLVTFNRIISRPYFKRI